MQRLRRVPGPLAVVLVIATIQSLAWIVLMPPFQGPDEDSHFTYVQRIWERQTIPWHPGAGTVTGQQISDELRDALFYGGAGPLRGNIDARPLWTRVDEQIWARKSRGADRSNGAYTSAFRNPPLYYLYEQVPYGLGSGGTIWDRQVLTRLANVPILLLGLVFIWLLAGELLGRGPLQFLATSAAAFVPQLLNEVTTVNPDIALVAEWSAALWVMALILKRGLRREWLIALFLLNVVGALTQPRSIPLIVPSVLAVLLALAHERGWRRVTPLRAGAAAALVVGVVVLVWADSLQGNAREFVSYLWQFYLPKLGFMNTTIGPVTWDIHTAFIGRLFGGLAQLEVTLPPNVDDALWWAARIGLAALVVALVIRRRGVRENAALVTVLVTAIWALLITLHLAAYRALLTSPGDPIITGRYLLPLIGLFGIAIAIVASVLPRAVRAVYVGVVVAAGVALQLISLGLMVERFYA